MRSGTACEVVEVESRVGSLALTVRAPAGRVDALAPVAEEFTARILSRCDELLEAKAPGRVVLVRQLDLSLRLWERALEHEGEIEAFAGELADDIARRAAAADETAASDPEIAVFEDEVAWRAAHMEARALGQSESAWRFEALEAEGEPWRTLVEGGPTPQLTELLVRLHRRGTLRSSLGAMSADVIERVASNLELLDDAGDVAFDVPLVEAVTAAVAALAALGPAVSKEAIAAAVHTSVRRSIGGAESTSVMGTIEKAEIRSAFGGLFYLLNPALELSMAESLWSACLPEGLVLAQATALLLGSAGSAAREDAAAALFGGTNPHDRLPAVSEEQQSEISLALLAAVRDALPRRGLAELPAVVLRLVDSAAGRLLVVAASGSPYAIFAFPARSPAEAKLALDAFLGLWPASAPPPRATPALAEFDRRARVRPIQEAAPALDLLIAEADTLPACALLTQIAGSLAHLFAARTGVPRPLDPSDLVTCYLSAPARVQLTHDTMEIRIPAEQVSLDVRRAGLDANPGWVPWLRRQVTLSFEQEHG